MIQVEIDSKAVISAIMLVGVCIIVRVGEHHAVDT